LIRFSDAGASSCAAVVTDASGPGASTATHKTAHHTVVWREFLTLPGLDVTIADPD
jgi:hypothetical protein